MKAKKVNEFKRTRKQGLSKQTELGIVQYTKKQIEEWFKKYLPNVNYEIKDDLSVICYNSIDFEGNTEITEFPFNNLKLPDKYLDIENSSFEKLPEYLDVDNRIYLANTKISKLPKYLKTNSSVYIENTLITEIPETIQVKRYIYINEDQVKYFKNSKFIDKIKVMLNSGIGVILKYYISNRNNTNKKIY